MITGHEIVTVLETGLASGAGLALLTQALKRFGWLDKLAHEFVVLASVAGGAAAYVIQYHARLPKSVAGVSMVSVYGFSQLLFKGSQRVNSVLGKVYANKSASTPVSTPAATDAPVEPTVSSEAAPAENVLSV